MGAEAGSSWFPGGELWPRSVATQPRREKPKPCCIIDGCQAQAAPRGGLELSLASG